MIGHLPSANGPTCRAVKRGCLIVLLGIGTMWSAWAPTSSYAVGQCGGQKDTCKCGKNNPYPCCANGSNCTWWAWHEACCKWNIALPGWGNANTWHSYAKKHPDFVVNSSPSVGSIATSTKGTYGHVAWVTAVGNGTVTVREMNCCGTCKWGMGSRVHKTSYFNSGFVRPKPKGPVCGNKKCEGGENCASCAKDCGSCCGNKKCDHGETCTSCAKDCVCLPKGSFEVAGSTTMRGWAQDPNAPSAKVSVEVRADGEKIATSPANQAHSKVKGHGFRVMTPIGLCDAKPHSMTVVGIDTAGKGKPSLGKRALSCRSDEVVTGPFLSSHHRASAIQAQANTDGKAGAKADGITSLARLQHVHPAGSPYAVGGFVESCITPGVHPFDAVHTTVSRAMGSLPMTTELRVDGTTVGTLKADGSAKTDGSVKADGSVKPPAGMKPPGTVTTDIAGMDLCMRTWGTAEQVHSKAGTTTLTAPRFRRAGWWYGLEAEGYGLRIDLASEAEPTLRGTTMATGALRLWRPLTEPFDHLRARVQRPDGRSGVALLPSIDAPSGVALMGSVDLQRLPSRQVLALRWTREGMDAKGSAGELSATPLLAMERVRISGNATRTLGMFHVEHQDSFGLLIAAPTHPHASIHPRDLGLRLAMHHRDAGWWSTGSVVASLTLPGPDFDRIRLRMRGQHGVVGLQLSAETEAGHVVLPQPAATSGDRQFEIALGGKQLRLRWQLKQDRWRAPEADVALSHIALCRGGWWTEPSTDARGLWDNRTSSGDVSLHVHGGDAPASDAPTSADASDSNDSAAEELAQTGLQSVGPALGTWLVSRELTTPQTAVRFTLRQALPPGKVRLRVLLDDTPMAVLETPTASEKPVVLGGKTFQRLGLMLQVKPGALAVQGYAVFEHVELRGVDGVWRRANTLPIVLAEALQPSDTVGQPRPATQIDADVTSGGADASGGDTPAQSGGCRVAPTGATPTGAMPLSWLGFVGLAAVALRRRRDVGGSAGAQRGQGRW